MKNHKNSGRSRSPQQATHRAPTQLRQARGRNSAANARLSRSVTPQSLRGVAQRNLELPFSPPEDWHEPTEAPHRVRYVVKKPGFGYRHVVTPAEVADRLAQLPQHFVKDLQVIQFSQMTRKKQSLPCYGMQWGSTLYLYPVDEGLIEYFPTPPPPAIANEARMYGGVWRQGDAGSWTLHWTTETIRDFYLNNILIHELGHLLDNRNAGYTDRERYAEWFATEFGYRNTGGWRGRNPSKQINRRHHTV
ncbi:hypothetical protein [Botrimarina hoheduenensis]|uniref:Uncharacterized protein n=1 Tax=Botrimarina hoheduenensis TaxID=2528000 RepID=A0A5C5VSM4_9BACT|nr:hypothetical protein [Botrimarina hoheduenensis]TWT41628.1 hypothetical protein Pla111_30050 [Botrimarina hoheduenensis]